MSHLYDGLTIIALLGIAGSIFKFGYEFRRDGARQRSDLYDKLRERFDGEEFDNIFTALDNMLKLLLNKKLKRNKLFVTSQLMTEVDLPHSMSTSRSLQNPDLSVIRSRITIGPYSGILFANKRGGAY
jgi:hypothetical protein